MTHRDRAVESGSGGAPGETMTGHGVNADAPAQFTLAGMSAE